MIKKAQSEAQEIIAKSKKAGDKLKEDIENKAKEKADSGKKAKEDGASENGQDES